MLAAIVLAGSAASRGIDYVDCEFDAPGGVLTVTEQISEGSLIRRSGERIAVLQPDGRAGFEEVDCGATDATVANADSILYRLTSKGITEARLSLAAGPLAPGRTDEGATSEIETTVRPSRQVSDAEFSIEGGSVDDHFRAGRLGPIAGVNLNAALEASDPDVDVTVERPRRVRLTLKGGEGNDMLDLNGGSETTGPFASKFAFLVPGPGKDIVRSTRTSVYAFGSQGADRIRLSRRFDVAEGGRGRDRISTGSGRDLILPGPGRDVVRAGEDNDEILGASGGIDVIDCGPGRDRASAGHHDRLRRCETVKRLPERAIGHFHFD